MSAADVLEDPLMVGEKGVLLAVVSDFEAQTSRTCC